MAAYGTGSSPTQARRRPGTTSSRSSSAPGSRATDGEPRPLTDLELLMFFNLLVVAGSETTRNSIALGHGRPDRASRPARGAAGATGR